MNNKIYNLFWIIFRVLIITTIPISLIVLGIEFAFEGKIISDNWSWLFILIGFDFLMIVGHFIQLRKLGVKNPIKETIHPTYEKVLELALTKEEIIKKLEQSSWKYKITRKEDIDGGVNLYMKYYKLSYMDKLEIEITTKEMENISKVIIKTGLKEKKWYQNPLDFGIHYKGIKYFEKILVEQEKG